MLNCLPHLLTIENPQSKIQNPQSHVSSPARTGRSGYRVAEPGAGGDPRRPLPVSRHARRRPTAAAARLAGADRRLHGLRGEPPRYRKTAEIAANPKVELCYLDDRHDQVRLTGIAEAVTDRALLQEVWDANPLMRQYLGSPDNPQLIVYRIAPTQVRFMREWALEYIDVPLE